MQVLVHDASTKSDNSALQYVQRNREMSRFAVQISAQESPINRWRDKEIGKMDSLQAVSNIKLQQLTFHYYFLSCFQYIKF